MQDASPAFDAEVLKPDRAPLLRVAVDWDRDGSFDTVALGGATAAALNRLPADDSTFEGGLGGWRVGGGATLARSDEQAVDGLWSAKVVATGGQVAWVLDDANAAAAAVPVTPGEVVSVGAFLRAAASGVGALVGPTNRVAAGGCTSTSQLTTQAGGVLHEVGLDTGAGVAPRAVPSTFTDYDRAGAFSAVSWTVQPQLDPTPASYRWAAQGTLQDGGAWLVGLESASGRGPADTYQDTYGDVYGAAVGTGATGDLYQDVYQDVYEATGGGTKRARFRVGGAVAAVANPAVGGAWAGPIGGEQAGYEAGIPYPWVTGTTYALRVARDDARGSDWWAAYVTGPGGTSSTSPPSIVSTSSGNSGSGTWPGGTPVPTSYQGGFVAQAGDLAILRQSFGGSTLTTTKPAGWSDLPGVTLPVTEGSNSRAYCWHKALAAGEAAPSFIPSGAQTGTWDLVVLRGAAGIGQAASATGIGTAIALPTLAGVAARSTLVGFAHHRVPAGTTPASGWTPDADWTERTDHATSRPSASAQNLRGTLATRADVAAGSHGGDVFATAGAGASQPTLNYTTAGGPTSSGCTNSAVTVGAGTTTHDLGGAAASTPAGTSPAVTPGTAAYWHDVAGTFGEVSWQLTVTLKPGGGAGHYWFQQGYTELAGGGAGSAWYAGLQTQGVVPSPAFTGDIVNFSVWNAEAAVAGDLPGTYAGTFGGEGEGYRVAAPYAWVQGTSYTFRVAAEPARGPRWFACYLKAGAGPEQWVGSIRARASEQSVLRGVAYQVAEPFIAASPSVAACALLPRSTATFTTPTFASGSIIAFQVEVLGVTSGGAGGETWIGSVQVPTAVGDLAGAVTQSTEWLSATALTSCDEIPAARALFGVPVHIPSGPGSVRDWRLVARWLTAAKGYHSQDSGPLVVDSADAWTEYKWENRTVPAGVAWVVAQVETGSAPPAGEAHYLDRVQVAKAPTVGAWTAGTVAYADDLSADVETLAVERELATDLPPEVTRAQGLAAAKATVTLAHRPPETAPEQDTLWYYSPYTPGAPLAQKRRKGAPAIVEVGFRTDQGPEFVRQLTGEVRDLRVNRGGGTATLEVLDYAERMRRQVALPPVVADGVTETGTQKRCGLNTTFIVDWVARACGFHASPPPRGRCVLSATFHGSAWPEVGSLQAAATIGAEVVEFTPTTRKLVTAARWVQALHFPGNAAHDVRHVLSPAFTVSTNNGRAVLVEVFGRLATTALDQPLGQAYNTGQQVPWVTPWWQASTGSFCLSFNRGGQDPTPRVAVGPTVSPGSGWHYWAVHVAFTSAGVNVVFRFDGQSFGPVHVATPSVTSAPTLDTFRWGRGPVSSFATSDLRGELEAGQVTAEPAPGAWNDGFVPTARIGPASADLLATPPTASEQGWGILQQVAAAVFAAAGFDEHGVFEYRTRRQLAAATTSVRTLRTSESLVDLASTESIDQVKNRITVKATPPRVADPGEVWRIGHVGGIGAGQTNTLWAQFATPVYNLDTTVAYSGDPNQGSRYLAGTNRDGSGSQVSNLQVTVTPFLQSAKVVIHNPNPFPAWLTVDANAVTVFGLRAGAPYLVLNGQKVELDADSAVRAEAVDLASTAAYGEQAYEPADADNPFRQVPEDAQELADDLLGMLKDPAPVLDDVPAVADPRLQLADRVSVVDPEGLRLAADFRLAKSTISGAAGGPLAQTVGLRGATTLTGEPPPPPPPPPEPPPPPPPAPTGDATALGFWRNRPGDSATWLTRMQAEESTYGTFVGHWHDYYAAGELPLSSGNETALASGKRLLVNWKPYPTGQGGNSWNYTASGAYDATLRAVFADLQAAITTNNLDPDDLWLCFAHEPDNDVNVLGTHAHYRAMWRHLHSVLVSEGLRARLKTVWLVMGWQKSMAQYGPNGFWPGAAPVDVIAHDPYVRAEEPAADLAHRIIDRTQWFRANAGSDRPWNTLPVLIGEFGSALGGNLDPYPAGDRDTVAHRAAAIQGVTSRLAEMVALGIVELNFFDARSDYLIDPPSADGAAFAGLKAATEAT